MIIPDLLIRYPNDKGDLSIFEATLMTGASVAKLESYCSDYLLWLVAARSSSSHFTISPNFWLLIVDLLPLIVTHSDFWTSFLDASW